MSLSSHTSFGSRSALVVVLLVVFIFSCKSPSDSSQPVNTGGGAITAGPSRQVGQQNVPSSGGTVKVTAPGDSLDGLTITVPDTAYADGRAFTVTEANVMGHSFGANFHPISPLITITNGGGYSTLPMVMRIPVKVTHGDFAMAFYYDSKHNKLEGLPVIAEDSTSITISTRHFDESTIASGAAQRGKASTQDLSHYAQIVVTAMAEAELENSDNTTGFEPGNDDWQFPNYGSTIAPGGHCFGQSIGMMWYYCTKKPALGELNHKYGYDSIRKTPAIWRDDVGAYKFCSVLQKHWNPGFMATVNGYANTKAKYTYLAFSYAIKLTAEPQLVCIYRPGSGHAMVIYRASSGRLSVCDPNYPTESTHFIDYDEFNETFVPYSGKANVDDTAHSYPQIYYYAKSAMIDWNGIAGDWAAFQNGSIGNGLFPDFHIQVSAGGKAPVELTDGMTLTDSMLTFSVTGAVPLKIWGIYGSDQNIVEGWPSLSYRFTDGTFEQGFAIYDATNHWVGFKWLTFTIQPPTLPPGGCTFSVTAGDKNFPVPGLWSNVQQIWATTPSIFIITLQWDEVQNQGSFHAGLQLRTADVVTGLGTYNIGPGTQFRTYVQPRTLVPIGPGSITITRWNGANDYAGTFKFDGGRNTIDTVTKVSGSFSCTP